MQVASFNDKECEGRSTESKALLSASLPLTSGGKAEMIFKDTGLLFVDGKLTLPTPDSSTASAATPRDLARHLREAAAMAQGLLHVMPAKALALVSSNSAGRMKLYIAMHQAPYTLFELLANESRACKPGSTKLVCLSGVHMWEGSVMLVLLPAKSSLQLGQRLLRSYSFLETVLIKAMGFEAGQWRMCKEADVVSGGVVSTELNSVIPCRAYGLPFSFLPHSMLSLPTPQAALLDYHELVINQGLVSLCLDVAEGAEELLNK